MKRFLLYISILLLFPSFANAQAVTTELKSVLSRDTILIGDRVEWTMRLDLKKGEEYHIEPPQDPVAEKLETVQKFIIDTLSLKKENISVQGKVILTCFDSGSYFLPSVLAMIKRTDGKIDTVFFDGPDLEVKTIPIDTSNYQIADIKGQIKYPVTFMEILKWMVLLLLLVVVVYVLIRFFKYRKQNKTFFGKPIIKDPPHITALRSLEKIRGQKLWQNNKQKQFYTAVTDTLRVYIAERFNIVTIERTSGEMLGDLKKEDVEEKTYGEISELFGRADLVKFAKYTASAEENEDVIPAAVRFINTTFIKELEQEKKRK